MDVIKIATEIRDKIYENEGLLKDLEKILKSQKKNSKVF